MASPETAAHEAVPQGQSPSLVGQILDGRHRIPPRRSFLWTEPVHREEFRIRAGAQLVGTTARGRLTVFLGCIVIAELPRVVPIARTGNAVPPPRTLPADVREHRRWAAHKASLLALAVLVLLALCVLLFWIF